jgi:hypothetical protein
MKNNGGRRTPYWHRVVAIVIYSVALSSRAQDSAKGADWRVYGTFEKDGKVYATMYSVPDIVRSPNGLARVWTQASSITTKDMDDALKDKQFLKTVAGRVKAQYMPPISSVEKINSDQVMHMIVLEEVANERKVYPTVVILEEIDCKNLRSRFLSMRTYEKGTPKRFTDDPGAWSYIQPQSNDKNLATLVCDPRLTAPDNTPAPIKEP